MCFHVLWNLCVTARHEPNRSDPQHQLYGFDDKTEQQDHASKSIQLVKKQKSIHITQKHIHLTEIKIQRPFKMHYFLFVWSCIHTGTVNPSKMQGFFFQMFLQYGMAGSHANGENYFQLSLYMAEIVDTSKCLWFHMCSLNIAFQTKQVLSLINVHVLAACI